MNNELKQMLQDVVSKCGNISSPDQLVLKDNTKYFEASGNGIDIANDLAQSGLFDVDLHVFANSVLVGGAYPSETYTGQSLGAKINHRITAQKDQIFIKTSVYFPLYDFGERFQM